MTTITLGAIAGATQLIEAGDEDTTEEELLEAWQVLVDSGVVWQLQGYYGRTASTLIERGLIHPAGAGR